MKALVLKTSESLEVMDVPKPTAAPGHVIVRVTKCGICGSDVRYYYGENPWAKQTLGKEIPNPPNIILGHEFVGIVEEVGDKADEALLGKRVAANTFITCGRCDFCRRGQENLCPNTKHLGHAQGWGKMDFYPGGMAEFCPVPTSQVYELDDNLSDDHATFLDPMIAALHATDTGAPQPLDRVAIVGAGPIGLLIAQYVQCYGAARTYICDLAEENVAIAKATGADLAMKTSKSGTDFMDAVLQGTGGEGANLIYNTIGTTESIENSLRMLKKGGTLVLLATKEKEIRFPALLLSGERTLKTSSNAYYSDFSRALDFLATGMIDVEPLISHRLGLSQALEAFQIACNKAESGAIKVVLDCQN
jgi:2-desacetyl-2-hydroxyethyl bacteriochlorophyllide A dehydrogenase